MLLWKLLGGAVIAISFACFAFGYVVVQRAIHRILPDWTSEATRDLMSGGLAGVTFIFLLGWTRFILTTGRRILLRAGRSSSDVRPPVLYLRSFVDDEKLPGLSGAPASSFEERIVAVLSKLGPVAAIGQPHEPLPPLGAQRTYAADADWENVVLGLMESAVAVVLRAGVTRGLQWEADAVVRHVDPSRVLIATAATSDEQYRLFAREVGHVFPRGLPTDCGPALWLRFDGDWSPQPLGLSRWKRILGQTRNSRAGITESLRPFCSRLGVELGRSQTLAASVMSPLIILVMASTMGYAVWLAREPVAHDLRLALREPVVMSERRTFSVRLPTGWDTMPAELAAKTPLALDVDRVLVRRIKFGYNGFGIFAAVERHVPGGDPDFLVQQVQQQFESEGALIVQQPFARLLGARHARELRLLTAQMRFVVLVMSGDSEGAFYYVRCWSGTELLDHHTELDDLVASIRPTT